MSAPGTGFGGGGFGGAGGSFGGAGGGFGGVGGGFGGAGGNNGPDPGAGYYAQVNSNQGFGGAETTGFGGSCGGRLGTGPGASSLPVSITPIHPSQASGQITQQENERMDPRAGYYFTQQQENERTDPRAGYYFTQQQQNEHHASHDHNIATDNVHGVPTEIIDEYGEDDRNIIEIILDFFNPVGEAEASRRGRRRRGGQPKKENWIDTMAESYIRQIQDLNPQFRMHGTISDPSGPRYSRSTLEYLQRVLREEQRKEASRMEPELPSEWGRRGAFREAKRRSGIPVSQQPSEVGKNTDRRGHAQPGLYYDFVVPTPGGGSRTIRIRDDAAGHQKGNRGPHFNDAAKRHYHYK